MSRPDRKIPLIELFGPTIQGEGNLCGQQTHFIRFGTCDYSCKMCDSKHAVEAEQVKKNATYLTAKEIALQMIEHNMKLETPWVTLSGGNPALWPLGDLVTDLQTCKMKVAIETQGTFKPAWIKQCDLVTVSPKGPGMTDDVTNWSLLDAYIDEILLPRAKGEQDGEGCLKIVIFDERDMEYAKSVWESCPDVPLYLSVGNPWLPGSDLDSNDHILKLLSLYRGLAEKLYEDRILNKATFLPQLHTLIYSNDLGR